MRKVSSIPPRTSIGIGIRGAGFKAGITPRDTQEEYTVRTYGEGKRSYKKPMAKKHRPVKIKTVRVEEALLDVFEESENTIKIVGEFPNSADGIAIEIEENQLTISNRSDSIEQYKSLINLPENFANASVEDCEVKNGIITILLRRQA